MSNDPTKRNDLTKPTKPERQTSNDAGSRLKRGLMADGLNRLFGHDESIDAPDQSKPPRVILALANHGRSPGWGRAKVLERQMFDAAAGSGLEMKFAFYGADKPPGCAAAGSRRDGSPTPTTWRRSWIGPSAAAAATSIFATCSRTP